MAQVLAEKATTTIQPMDEHNQNWISQVHPPDWQNPKPGSRYDLVVIGAGPAGLIAAAGAAGLGARVALVERYLMGGDCLNVGCVPSKTLIRSARVAAEIRGGETYGIRVPAGVEVDFPAVMARLRRLRAKISHHDAAKRYQEELGVDVFIGEGRFLDGESVAVADTTLRFRKAVIATGTRAAQLPIPGLKEVGYLTNETLFSLTKRPERLAVIGAGPIGCEMAQAFARLGCQVTLVHKGNHILNREDADAAEIVQNVFIRDGIRLILGATTQRVTRENGTKSIQVEQGGKKEQVEADEILVSVGRTPNVEGLNLDAAGVKYDTRGGVQINEFLQTTNPKIFAAGDICFPYKFTHVADAMARIVLQNALFVPRFVPFNWGKKKNILTIPWCTYTDPEIAHVGMYEKDAQAQGIAIDTFVQTLEEVDRAVADGETEGLVKVHVRKGTDEILGATIVARHAGEMISEITVAMVGKIGLGTIANVIHPYPTQAEAIKRVADAYNRTRLTPSSRRLLARLLKWS